MADLVSSTHNPHKFNEIRDLFIKNQANYPVLSQISLLNLNDIGYIDEIPETGDTLEANASMKAWTVYSQCKINCFADDTGLEVMVLEGRPGVYSARYAGKGKSFDKNIDKLLTELASETNRQARFRTVIALILNGQETLFEGIVNGMIIHEKRGTEGFGYDPVFLPDGFDQTLAEMTLDQKNQISHRYIAMQKLMVFLQETLSTNTISHF